MAGRCSPHQPPATASYSPFALSFLLEPRLRVDRLAALSNLEVQVRPLEAAGVAHRAERLAFFEHVAHFNLAVGQMGINEW